jgi:hypothetical protein
VPKEDLTKFSYDERRKFNKFELRDWKLHSNNKGKSPIAGLDVNNFPPFVFATTLSNYLIKLF